MSKPSGKQESFGRRVARFGRLLRPGLLGRFVVVLGAVGLIPLIIGCCADFDGWLHLGTVIRCVLGIIGAFLLLGALDSDGIGWMVTFVGGLLIYLFSIRSGQLHLLTIPYFDFSLFLDGWSKISVRIISVVAFILGFKDTYKHRSFDEG